MRGDALNLMSILLCSHELATGLGSLVNRQYFAGTCLRSLDRRSCNLKTCIAKLVLRECSRC